MYRYNKLLAKFSIITLIFVCHHANASQFVTIKSKVNSLEWAKQAISVKDCEYLAVFERSNSVFLQGGIVASIACYYKKKVEDACGCESYLNLDSQFSANYLLVDFSYREQLKIKHGIVFDEPDRYDIAFHEFESFVMKNSNYDLVGMVVCQSKLYYAYTKIGSRWFVYGCDDRWIDIHSDHQDFSKNAHLFSYLKEKRGVPCVFVYQKRTNVESSSSAARETVNSSSAVTVIAQAGANDSNEKRSDDKTIGEAKRTSLPDRFRNLYVEIPKHG